LVSSFTIRAATAEDAPDMVRLINIADHGLPLWRWGRLEGGEGDPWQAGRDSVRRLDQVVNWKNGTVATLGSDIVALLLAYPLERDTPTGEADHPVFEPLKTLKAKAVGSYYIHVLAAYAEYRRRGLGKLLMERAERMAGGRDLALIVSDGNAPARRFYDQLGFHEAAREAIVTADDWKAEGENWLLLVKPSRA